MLSTKGVYLTLMIGPAVPVPVPREVLDALTSVQVTTTSGSFSVFELTFTVNNQSPLQTLFLLSGGNIPSSIPPIMRVIIAVTINGVQEILMDGIMTEHNITPGTGGENSTLTIMGDDLTRLMHYQDFSGFPFPALSAEGRIAILLAKYAAFGIVPKIIPSVFIDVPLPIDRIPRQKGTDLQYINYLAEEVGYAFYISPGPKLGMSVAYWGPEIKVGVPQPALNVDMDAHTNVESLSFKFDNTSKSLPILFIQNPETKVPIPIPIPDINPINPPLGLVPPIPNKIDFINFTSKYSSTRAAAVGLAKAARDAEAVSGSGSRYDLRYCRALIARQLVGVRGAGTAFDGLYYVQSVTSSLKRGEFKQSFELSRNSLVSTVSKVPA